MAKLFEKLLSGAIEGLVRWVIVPVTGAIPLLVSSGILFIGFAAIWVGFGIALVANPSALGDAWRAMGALPLPILGLAWLLFLPPMAGLWAWATTWPIAVRLLVVVALAAWNLLVLVPPRPARQAAAVGSNVLEP